MKKITILLLGMFAIISLQAQNYYIDFTASGASTTLDSVFVENLTQGTSLTLGGSDTLHLIGTVDITDNSQSKDDIKIYPNPFNEKSYLEFYNETQTMIVIDIYDVVGKNVFSLRQEMERGMHIFEMSGFATGHYQLIVKTDSWQKSAAFVSLQTDRMQKPQLQFRSTLSKETYTNNATRNGSKNTVQMSYTTGNQMRFTGYTGALSEIVNDVPISSKTINFVFFMCGSTLTDSRDGNTYPTVQIDRQCWMAKNLAYLPSVVGSSTSSQSLPYYYVYGYNGTSVTDAKTTSIYSTYGVLYNWQAAMAGSASSSASPSGVQGICPTGWHLPSDAEWKTLELFLGMTQAQADAVGWRGTDEGGKLKETGTTHWDSPNTGATNSSGFTALPGGCRNGNGAFNHIGRIGSWWSSTEVYTWDAWSRRLDSNESNVYRYYATKNLGYSVRCLRD